jgi:exodeoxyribonuclease VII large subunit
LVSESQQTWLAALDLLQDRLQGHVMRYVDNQSQGLDRAQARLGRPSSWLAREKQQLQSHGQHLKFAVKAQLAREKQLVGSMQSLWPSQLATAVSRMQDRLERAERGLALLDPQLVLQRGYAWVTDEAGQTVTSTKKLTLGQALQVQLSQGQAAVTVRDLEA